VNRSFQASSEPLIPTCRLYWTAVQLAVQLALYLFDSHQMNSRWRAYLVFLSRFFSCAQSTDQSAPVYKSGSSKAPSFESIDLVNSRKSHIFPFSFTTTPSGRTLRNEWCGFVFLTLSLSQIHFVMEFRYCQCSQASDDRVASLCIRHQASVCRDFPHFPLVVLDGTN